MSREAEVEALNRVSASHFSWSEAQQRLHVAMKAADDQDGPAPVAELQADYAAQKDLVRDVVAFVDSCGPGGPDVEGLAGAAFILALFQAASVDGVERELAEFDAAMTGWWPALAAWTPDHGDHPPRPRSDTFDRIVDAANNWIECLDERETDLWARSLAAQGAEVTRTFTPTGSVLQAHLPLAQRAEGSTPEAIGTVRRDGSLGAHLGRMWRAPLRVVARTRAGEVDLLATHWTAGRAWRDAHKARLGIEPSGWVEVWEWTFRGYKLVDVMPWLDPARETDDGGEFVYGVLDQGDTTPSGATTHMVGVIGVIRPESRGWSIMVRDKDNDTFHVPRLLEFSYLTWAEATAGVRKLFDRQVDRSS